MATTSSEMDGGSGLTSSTSGEHYAAQASEQEQLVSIVETLRKDFPDLCLEGSPLLKELKFEPGNAYNSQVIQDTKRSGQKVFEFIADTSIRKARINEQVRSLNIV
jgi:hypothetical protein